MRKALVWLIVAGLLLLAGGGWWLSRPKALRVVGTFPVNSDGGMNSIAALATSDAGFLLRDDKGDFVLYDWHTGHARWRVTPAADLWHRDRWYVWAQGGPGLFDGHSTYALSPHGRFFATATHTNGRMRVQIWMDGTLSTDLMLPDAQFPVATDCAFPLGIADSGRLYINQARADEHTGQPKFTVHAGLIENGKLVAIGEKTGTYDAEENLLLTTDGMASAVYAVARDGNRLTYTPLYRANVYLERIIDRDTYLASNGRIHHRLGAPSKPMKFYDYVTMTPRGCQSVLLGAKQAPEVVDMRDGTAWHFTDPVIGPTGSRGALGLSPIDDAAASSDGRFAVVAKETVPTIPARLRYWKRFHPRLLGWLPEGRQLSLRVYERPGRWRAHLLEPLTHPRPSFRGPYTTVHLSPDGHSVLLGPEEGPQGLQFRLFRW